VISKAFYCHRRPTWRMYMGA